MRTTLLLAVLCLQLPAQDNTSALKIAVIGLRHSHVWGHLPTILQSKDVRLVGIAESNQELSAEAVKMGADKSLLFSDAASMLEQTKPDLVWAFVENNRHLEIARLCAPKHIHIIYEKPLASTYADAQQIRELARQNHVMVMTNYQMAWWPATYTAKTVVDRGDIGTVFSLHGLVGNGGPGPNGVRNKYFFEWLTDPVQNGAGALMDFGCYNMLWSLWYLGMPQSVFATANHLRPDRFPKVEDDATIVLTYPNAIGEFQGSWELPRSFQDLEVVGRPNGKAAGTLVATQKGVILEQGQGVAQHLPLDPLSPDATQPVAYMVSRIRSKQPIEGLTAIDINVNVVRLIDLAIQSVKTGASVKVPASAE